ncbi:unnamed protein product [Cyprideis torosa]|uniref:Protein root UVB sensitive/RUS domain-containing protein n=1 Tax=Cyprideis torosa TaxID=163714 RepID=A0A7R8WCA2_9CRUS|nr:unnamed protein product [Cyprideis torosa]CAG0887201.1 unnamed protein product [Cyprideis torosa]
MEDDDRTLLVKQTDIHRSAGLHDHEQPLAKFLSSGKRSPSTNKGLKKFFYDAFLPEGYPDSVCPEYAEFVFWDCIQTSCSALNVTIAIQAVLLGIGVGEWRFFADMAWNLSLILEMISPVFKSLFLFFLLASSIAKGLCMVSAQAAWTGIGTNQARKDNLADLNAKFHSQNRGVNFVSTICTLTLIHIIGNHPKMVLSLFVTSMCIHVGISMRVAQVQLYKDLNLLRFQVVYFEWQRSGVFLTPRQANDREPLFPVTELKKAYILLHPNVTSKEKLHAVYDVFQRWYPGPSGSHFELFYTGLASAGE